MLDWQFYGNRVLTPLNYFYSNIILHKAEGYGINPWWFYFTEFYSKALPPLSVVLLILFAAGITKNLKKPLVWVILAFILMHCFIAHKELRFLFTITYSCLYAVALGLDYLLTNTFYQKIHRYVYFASLVMIVPLFLYSVFFAEDKTSEYSYFLYNNISAQNNTLFLLSGERDWGLLGATSTFYRSPLMKDVYLENNTDIAHYMDTNHIDSAFFLDKKTKTTFTLPGYKTEKAYCFYPIWLQKLDANREIEGADVWTIYRVSKIKAGY